jgi:cytosine/adenosine deaminase-related metal-dependent hydrolase
MFDVPTSTPRARDVSVLAELKSGDAKAVLLSGGVVISMDPAIGDLARGDVLIVGDTIAAVGQDLAALAATHGALVVDASEVILLPGFHDTHRHAWQSQLRRLLPDGDLASYLTKVHASLAHHYRPIDMYVGNLISALGAIDSGVTTVLDFSHNSRSAAHTDAAIEAWNRSGIRAVHASSAPMDGDWDAQWPKDLARAKEELPATGLVTLRMALLGQAVDIIPDLVALNEGNIAYARELGLEISVDGAFGDKVGSDMERLGRAGVLGPDLTFIHCTDLPPGAWAAIADSGAHISLAPTSDAQVGILGGKPPVQKAMDLGLNPSIGVDIECSLASDFFSQMRALLTIQRQDVFTRRYAGDNEAPALLTDREVLGFATINGAHANGLGNLTGSLTPGKKADVIGIRANDVNLFPLNNAIGTVVQGADPRNIEFVLVAGAPVKWGGQVLGLDLDRVRELATESRDFLLGKAGTVLDVVS